MKNKNFDIKERRLELGLTLEDVANKVGVGKSTVRKWETGDIKNMRRDNMAALANALNIDPLLLLFDDVSEEYKNTYGNHEANLEYFADKPEVLEMYKEIYENENLALLFDTARELKPEELEKVLKYMKLVLDEEL